MMLKTSNSAADVPATDFDETSASPMISNFNAFLAALPATASLLLNNSPCH